MGVLKKVFVAFCGKHSGEDKKTSLFILFWMLIDHMLFSKAVYCNMILKLHHLDKQGFFPKELQLFTDDMLGLL